MLPMAFHNEILNMKDYTYLVLVINSLNYDDDPVPNGKDVVVEGICVGVDVGVDVPVGKGLLVDVVDDADVDVVDGIDVVGVDVVEVAGVVDLDVVDLDVTITFPEVSIDDKIGLLFGIPILYPTNTRIIGNINKR